MISAENLNWREGTFNLRNLVKYNEAASENTDELLNKLKVAQKHLLALPFNKEANIQSVICKVRFRLATVNI